MSRRTLHDQYFRKARSEGYAARSAYKLKQIQEARRIIRAGSRVLDLGCAPGAWLQVAGELVGPKGRVVGFDLQEVRITLPDHVGHAVGDIFKTDAATLTQMGGGESGGRGGLYDTVLSDMAPNTTGHGDAERSAALCQRVMELLPGLLSPTGSLAMKVLEGSGYKELLADVRGRFTQTKAYKPDASRDMSREIYITAKGFVK